MYDFMCKDYKDIHYEVVRKRVQHFKETEGGKQKMCEIFDEIKNKGKLEGKQELIKNFMLKNQATFEEAMRILGIPKEEEQLFRKHIYS